MPPPLRGDTGWRRRSRVIPGTVHAAVGSGTGTVPRCRQRVAYLIVPDDRKYVWQARVTVCQSSTGGRFSNWASQQTCCTRSRA